MLPMTLVVLVIVIITIRVAITMLGRVLVHLLWAGTKLALAVIITSHRH